jgi:hypothetical protein
MMNTKIPQDFRTGNGYVDSLSGTASQSYNSDGTIVNLKSPLGISNGSMKKFFITIEPGDEVEFEVWARNIKGDPRISIDLFAKDGNQLVAYQYEKIIGDSFKSYKLHVKVPYNHDYCQVGITIGTWNSISDDSEGEFMYPKLSVKSNLTSMSVLASGLIMVQNGVASMHSNFRTFGITSVSYSDATKKITLTLKQKTLLTIGNGQYPVIQATATGDNYYPALAGNYDNNNNTFIIMLTNGTAPVSLNTGNFYIFVEAKI